jgi:hypothetical protein
MKKSSFMIIAVLTTIILTSCPGIGPDPATYTVTYDGTEADGGSVPIDTMKYTEGQIVTVLGNTGNLVKSRDSFMNLNTHPYGIEITYIGGDTFTMGLGDVTLYAQWAMGH